MIPLVATRSCSQQASRAKEFFFEPGSVWGTLRQHRDSMHEGEWMPDVSDEQLRQLVDQGLSQREIARRTGIARATLYGRMRRLGLTPVPQATPAPPAAHAPRVPAPPATPAVTFVAVPEIQEILSIVRDLQSRVVALEQAPAPPALTVPPAAHGPPAATAVAAPPTPPAAERKDVQQWTIRVSKAWIDYVKRVAYERRLNPSEVVEECLWQAFQDQSAAASEQKLTE